MSKQESVLAEKGNPDIEKVRPIVYGTGDVTFYGIGKALGKAFSIGKKLNNWGVGHLIFEGVLMGGGKVVWRKIHEKKSFSQMP